MSDSSNVLSSRLPYKAFLPVHVLKEGNQIKISIVWPMKLYIMYILPKKWLKCDTGDRFGLHK